MISMGDKKTDEQKQAEELADNLGPQEGRKPDDPVQQPQNPTEDHGGGDSPAGGDETAGLGPSGGGDRGVSEH